MPAVIQKLETTVTLNGIDIVTPLKVGNLAGIYVNIEKFYITANITSFYTQFINLMNLKGSNEALFKMIDYMKDMWTSNKNVTRYMNEDSLYTMIAINGMDRGTCRERCGEAINDYNTKFDISQKRGVTEKAFISEHGTLYNEIKKVCYSYTEERKLSQGYQYQGNPHRGANEDKRPKSQSNGK